MSSKFIYLLIIVAVIAGGYGLYHKMNRDTVKSETLAKTASAASATSSTSATSGNVAAKETASSSSFVPFSVTRALSSTSDEKSANAKCTVDSAMENNKREIGDMFGKTIQKLMISTYDTDNDGVISHEEREVIHEEMMEMRDKVDALYAGEDQDLIRKDMEQTFRRIMTRDFQKYDADHDQILSEGETTAWSDGLLDKFGGKKFTDVFFKEVEQTRSQRRAGELGL